MTTVTPLPAMVRLRCDRCGRKGQYRRERFIELAGTDIAPSALLPFARAVRCPVALAQNDRSWGERCGVVYDRSSI
jgi:hypothetical protein